MDFFLHLDKTFGAVIAQYGTWTYGILFLVIFCETGLVVTPFLPGDSLLFAAGAFAAIGSLNIWWLLIVLLLAAFTGDTVNYWIGRRVGPEIFHHDHRWLKKDHLLRTQKFFEHYGAQAVILGRFVPVIRTFVPFVAGIGTLQYKRFMAYNVIGGLVWVSLFTFGGYFFGNIPFIKKNFTAVILVIVFLSILPPVVEWFRHKSDKVANV